MLFDSKTILLTCKMCWKFS